MDPSWKERLKAEFGKGYFQELSNFLKEERSTYRVYPPAKEVFAAFEYTPLDKVKVVILGQDPYHGNAQAHGLSFSVLPGMAPPPSLRNIYKELKNDLGLDPPPHGCLYQWAKQGVFLLNCVLTVREGEAASHRNRGWETFTNKVIEILGSQEDPLIFILWGRYARDKSFLIQEQHATLQSAHPSPLSADNGFFGSKPFSKANAYLESWGKTPIDWQLNATPIIR